MDVYARLSDLDDDLDFGATKKTWQVSCSAVDDDMSDDDVPLVQPVKQPFTEASHIRSPAKTPTSSPSRQVTAGTFSAGRLALPMKVAECKAQVERLEAMKKEKLAQEDYMAAHSLKQEINEYQMQLQALQRQLDTVATPTRRMSVASRAAAASREERSKSGAKRPLVEHEMATPTREATANTNLRGEPSETAAVIEAPECTEELAESDIYRDHVQSSDDEESTSGQWRASASRGLIELSADSDSVEIPFALEREKFDKLFDYQRAGLAWMARLYQAKQGGILADEMGLGKTVQVCSLFNGARKAGATHALVLLPISLLGQWAKEARKWCPGWPVHIYYGTTAERARALRRVMRPTGGLLLTSYSLLGNTDCLFDVFIDDAPSPQKKGRPAKRRRLNDDDLGESDEEEEVLPDPEMPGGGWPRAGERKPWDIVVCDEAHRMKNMKSLLGKSLRQVRSRSRVLLSGTPVQNALQDLWSLMDFAQPGLLGNHATFVKEFSDKIEKGSVRDANPFESQLKKHLAEQLRTLIMPHLLRRTKADVGLIDNGETSADVNMGDGVEEEENSAAAVAKLPPKKDTIVWLSPTNDQILAYQKILEKSEVIREACAKSKLGIEVFRAIGMLKRLCNHPLLLLQTKRGEWPELLQQANSANGGADDDFETSEGAPEPLGADGAEEEEARAGRSVEMMLKKLPRSCEAMLDQSAKLRCMSQLLPALASKGHRTLVFSQSLKMLDLVQTCCLKPKGLRCLRIDGQTDAVTRTQKIDKFEKHPERFQFMLLTTSVGGVGLNLVCADRVVIVDPAWNPATDAQAVDRAFRIGQDKRVKVYRLVMSGLIEDKMFRLQVFKMGLSKTALEAEQQKAYFTAREIRALFEWTDPAEGETRKHLLEQQGEDTSAAIQQAADEDGASEGWFAAGPTVGLSDFSTLYSGMSSKDEEMDGECLQQVEEAKQKLGAADEKFQQMQEARQTAEMHRDATAKELEEAGAKVEVTKEVLLQADKTLKEKRAEVVQARRAEASSQQQLERGERARSNAQDQKQRGSAVVQQTEEHLAMTTKAVEEAASTTHGAEESFQKAVAAAEAQVGTVDIAGKAIDTCPVDAASDRVKKAHKALEKLQSMSDALQARHAEVTAAEEDLNKADGCLSEAEIARVHSEADDVVSKKTAEIHFKSREKDRQRAEQALSKATQKAETAFDSVAQSAAAFVEMGLSFAESFQKVQSRPVRVDQVKFAQQTANRSFKQISSALKQWKSLRDGLAKTVLSRRKALLKFHAAAGAAAEGEKGVVCAEREFASLFQDAQERRKELSEREADLASAEAARETAELEERESKRKREELRSATLPAAKEAVRSAIRAEKEATAERHALHNACSKVEKSFSQMEGAMQSASALLKGEAYNPNQVEEAYSKEKEKKVAGES